MTGSFPIQCLSLLLTATDCLVSASFCSVLSLCFPLSSVFHCIISQFSTPSIHLLRLYPGRAGTPTFKHFTAHQREGVKGTLHSALCDLKIIQTRQAKVSSILWHHQRPSNPLSYSRVFGSAHFDRNLGARSRTYSSTNPDDGLYTGRATWNTRDTVTPAPRASSTPVFCLDLGIPGPISQD
ncbi:hypothetical protein B0H65DRAFT_479274 [Neurospora tetraspora]|uniref:Secreted protein n=1 Tax=Neurospora tetraspora TaxID=94610 RepID=A0AAE0MNF0_9PEZI|nr:hypothetical protein B0H65DRAFT_479274 [Neurospora tetraspora]